MPLLYQSFDDRYWNSLPAALRKLRTLPETNSDAMGPRWDLAEQLESEGYAIEVPIHVWGWTPTIVYENSGRSTDPNQFKLASDLIVRENPMGQWPLNRTEGYWPPSMKDKSGVGAVYPNEESPTHQKQLVRIGVLDQPMWVENR